MRGSGGGGWARRRHQKGPWASGCVPRCSHQSQPSRAASRRGCGRSQLSAVWTAAWQLPQAQGGPPLSPSSDLPCSVSPKDQGELSAQWLLCEPQRGVQPSPLSPASLPGERAGAGAGRCPVRASEVRGVQLPGDADQREAVKAGFLLALDWPCSRTGLPWPRDTHRGPGVTGSFTLM